VNSNESLPLFVMVYVNVAVVFTAIVPLSGVFENVIMGAASAVPVPIHDAIASSAGAMNENTRLPEADEYM
jgi:hypothetical protein